eukprot:11159525-Alexandrium_andersonii.AAC.1
MVTRVPAHAGTAVPASASARAGYHRAERWPTAPGSLRGASAQAERAALPNRPHGRQERPPE